MGKEISIEYKDTPIAVIDIEKITIRAHTELENISSMGSLLAWVDKWHAPAHAEVWAAGKEFLLDCHYSEMEAITQSLIRFLQALHAKKN